MTKKQTTVTEADQNAVTLKKDSKDNYGWEIKLYFDENEEEALVRLNMMNESLKKTYKSHSPPLKE